MTALRTLWQRDGALPRWTIVLAVLSLGALPFSPDSLRSGILGLVAGPWAMVLGMTLVMHAMMPARIVSATRVRLERSYTIAAWSCVVAILGATAWVGERWLTTVLVSMVVVGGVFMGLMALWFHRRTGAPGAEGDAG